MHTFGDLAHDVQTKRIVDALAATRPRYFRVGVQKRAQITAVHILKNDEVFTVGGNAQVVDLDDVFMRQRGMDARFCLKHLHESRVVGQTRQDTFDDHQLFETLFATCAPEEKLGHGAHGKAIEELVVTEVGSFRGKHSDPHDWRRDAHRMCSCSTIVAVMGIET